MPGHYVEIPVSGTPVSSSLSKVIIFRPEASADSGQARQELSFEAKAGSRTDITLIILPGVSAEIAVNVDLTGEGASLRLAGLYICGSSEKVSVRTVVRHRSPLCTSDQMFTGIAGGAARVAFNGTIVVAPGAQKTEAYQQSRNILLSGEAKVDTEPQLEIYADDVKCSHGATAGSLNEDELFYMRSRGIPENEAKVLQLISFLSPVLAGLPEGTASGQESLPDRGSIASELETAIRSII